MKPKRKRLFWSAQELRRLIKLYPSRPTKEIARTLDRTLFGVYGAANKLGLKKTAEFIASPASRARLQKGTRSGAAFRFQKGHVPANKGLRRPGWHAGRMKETQFKKGALSGKAALNHKPVGTILVDHEGYLRIKVRERLPGDASGWNSDIWPLLHHKVWRETKGPIPPKHIVTFKDKDRSRCVIENLELMSKADNARRNAMWNRFPPELIGAIMANGVLKRKLRRNNG
jgi:hypothetical protein